MNSSGSINSLIFLSLVGGILLIPENKLRADAAPHLGNDAIRHHPLTLNYDTTGGIRLDSALLILPRDSGGFDTASNFEKGAGAWIGLGRKKEGWNENIHLGHEIFSIVAARTELPPFRVLLYFNNRTLISPVLNELHTASEYGLTVRGNSVFNDSPFFQISWTNYFDLLFITILIESVIALVYFRRRRVPLWKVHSIITANLISHPLLWTLCTYVIGFDWGLFFGEVGVVAFEAWWLWLFCKQFLALRQCVKLSLLMNFLSYVFGGIIVWFLQ